VQTRISPQLRAKGGKLNQKMRLFSQIRRAKRLFRPNQDQRGFPDVTFRLLKTICIAGIIACGFAGTALAQNATPAAPPPGLGPRVNAPAGAQPAPPPVENVAKHGQWQVQCSPAQGDQPKSCGMVLLEKSDKNPNIGLSLIINRVKQGDKVQVMMRAMVPVGVYLPTGVAMEIDGAALEGRMTFTRCNPQFCEAFGEASDPSLKKFMKGKVATFYIYDRPGNGYPIVFPLEGFADGLADLAKL
jgi:invasion protein IalB